MSNNARTSGVEKVGVVSGATITHLCTHMYIDIVIVPCVCMCDASGSSAIAR